jgi:hypothetical protein
MLLFFYPYPAWRGFNAVPMQGIFELHLETGQATWYVISLERPIDKRFRQGED